MKNSDPQPEQRTCYFTSRGRGRGNFRGLRGRDGRLGSTKFSNGTQFQLFVVELVGGVGVITKGIIGGFTKGIGGVRFHCEQDATY